MTKLININDEDKEYIDKTYLKLYNLFVGTELNKGYNAFREYFLNQVREICFYDKKEDSKHLNEVVDAISSFNLDGTAEIELYKPSIEGLYDNKSLRRKFVHELCHTFIHVLTNYNKKDDDEEMVYIGNEIHTNFAGLILVADNKNILKKFIMRAFNETMVDIITTMIIDSNESIDINRLLDTKCYKSNGIKGYDLLFPVLKLTILAFFNTIDYDYEKSIENGENIFNRRVILNDKETSYINDFMYGIIFDQLHIEITYDEIMGAHEFEVITKDLDSILSIPNPDYKFLREVIKRYIKRITVFHKCLNLKNVCQRKIDIKESEAIKNNYNKMLEYVLKEYSITLDEKDYAEMEQKLSAFAIKFINNYS